MWTGNYNIVAHLGHNRGTLAGSMWIGNYNYVFTLYAHVKL